LIVAELIKSRLNHGERPGMYFWRDSNGNEVDVIIEAGDRLIPVEIKSGKTVARDFFAGLEKWQNLAGTRALNPVLIYGGDDKYRHAMTDVIGWRNVGQGAFIGKNERNA
jgi:predicted AAA+ superfamily ATPase